MNSLAENNSHVHSVQVKYLWRLKQSGDKFFRSYYDINIIYLYIVKALLPCGNANVLGKTSKLMIFVWINKLIIG